MNAVEYVVFPGAVNKDTRYEQLHLKISDWDLQNFSPECECWRRLNDVTALTSLYCSGESLYY